MLRCLCLLFTVSCGGGLLSLAAATPDEVRVPGAGAYPVTHYRATSTGLSQAQIQELLAANLDNLVAGVEAHVPPVADAAVGSFVVAEDKLWELEAELFDDAEALATAEAMRDALAARAGYWPYRVRRHVVSAQMTFAAMVATADARERILYSSALRLELRRLRELIAREPVGDQMPGLVRRCDFVIETVLNDVERLREFWLLEPHRASAAD